MSASADARPSGSVSAEALDGLVCEVVDLVLAHQGAGIGSPHVAIKAAMLRSLPITLERTSAPTRPATERQRTYIAGLLEARTVPADLRRRAQNPDLTHADCTDLIPLLLDCPKWRGLKRDDSNDGSNDDGYITPEGYDDGPDQGVHQFDGGGAFF